MAKQDTVLTTGEFALKAGLTTSSVTKMIREGKIKAKKVSGKWMISPDQLKAKSLQDATKSGNKTSAIKAAAKKSAPPRKDKPAKAKTTKVKTYTVAEFAAMTYLTEFGVMEWLKQGRLTGQHIAGGEWKVEAANL